MANAHRVGDIHEIRESDLWRSNGRLLPLGCLFGAEIELLANFLRAGRCVRRWVLSGTVCRIRLRAAAGKQQTEQQQATTADAAVGTGNCEFREVCPYLTPHTCLRTLCRPFLQEFQPTKNRMAIACHAVSYTGTDQQQVAEQNFASATATISTRQSHCRRDGVTGCSGSGCRWFR